MIRSSLPLALALAPLLALPQEPEEGPERYPQVLQERVLRYYHLKGKLDLDKLNAAAKDAGFEIAYGPMEAGSRPSNSVVAVSVPFEARSRDVERALKKAKLKVAELEVFLYRGRIENGFPTFGLGLKKIDYMLGISGEIKWCDMFEGWTQFYCVKGELDAEEIEGLWRKLQRPLGDEPATLGEVVRDELDWSLTGEVDERSWKKLEREIRKLEGVAEVFLDGSELHVTLDMAGLSATGLAQSFAGVEAMDGGPPRITFSSRALWVLLAAEGLVSGED